MGTRDESDELLRLLPPIRRARLWRLYAEGQAAGRPRRFLDLWMDGGRSLLGAKGTGLGTEAKAAIDRGLTGPAPSVWERRLEKALLAAYPGYAAARFYRSEEAALEALEAHLGKARGQLAILDPALRDSGRPGDSAASGGAEALVARPFAAFLPGQAALERGLPAFALPLLPCPAALAPGVILARDASGAPRGELAPPLLLASACRALAELARLGSTYREELWRRSDRRLAPFFERRGPYLYPRHGPEEHGAFFRRALEAGLLVSPRHELPSMLPGEFDDGELAALGKAFKAG